MPPVNATNSSGDALQVICVWPVSGQYGPGSRVLYYVLIAACVLARKVKWFREPALAAALIFPAVAALHGIVLASVHVNGALDMDVYGAFQFCSIGILAASLAVRRSETYFNDPGRNTIFLWTGLLLAGLCSLVVEFYRVNPTSCTHDDLGNPISRYAKDFPYGNATCGLVCMPDNPTSPMRGGSANNNYVVPVPYRFTLGAGMLVSAACCIPAILSLVSTFTKILDRNWKRRSGEEEEKHLHQPIEGTNGATPQMMNGVNDTIRSLLAKIEFPLFGGAVITILGLGESNFFSTPVSYQTEPIASVGQWAPIAGTVIAALGTLYLVLTGGAAEVHHCSCPHHEGIVRVPTVQIGSDEDSPPGSRRSGTISRDAAHARSRSSNDLEHTMTGASIDTAHRGKLGKTLTALSDKLAATHHEDHAEFRSGAAGQFPLIPAEEERNANLPSIQERYNQRSRTNSFTSASSGESPSPNGDSRPNVQTAPRRRSTLEVPAPVYFREPSEM